MRNELITIKNSLASDPNITAIVPADSIRRSFTEDYIDIPGIVLSVLDHDSTPPLGYASSKERYERYVIRITVYVDSSQYEADQLVELIDKNILNLNFDYPPIKVGYDEDYNRELRLFIRRISYEFRVKVKDS